MSGIGSICPNRKDGVCQVDKTKCNASDKDVPNCTYNKNAGMR